MLLQTFDVPPLFFSGQMPCQEQPALQERAGGVALMCPFLMSEAGDKTQFPESILWIPQLRGLLE